MPKEPAKRFAYVPIGFVKDNFPSPLMTPIDYSSTGLSDIGSHIQYLLPKEADSDKDILLNVATCVKINQGQTEQKYLLRSSGGAKQRSLLWNTPLTAEDLEPFTPDVFENVSRQSILKKLVINPNRYIATSSRMLGVIHNLDSISNASVKRLLIVYEEGYTIPDEGKLVGDITLPKGFKGDLLSWPIEILEKVIEILDWNSYLLANDLCANSKSQIEERLRRYDRNPVRGSFLDPLTADLLRGNQHLGY